MYKANQTFMQTKHSVIQLSRQGKEAAHSPTNMTHDLTADGYI